MKKILFILSISVGMLACDSTNTAIDQADNLIKDANNAIENVVDSAKAKIGNAVDSAKAEAIKALDSIKSKTENVGEIVK